MSWSAALLLASLALAADPSSTEPPPAEPADSEPAGEPSAEPAPAEPSAEPAPAEPTPAEPSAEPAPAEPSAEPAPAEPSAEPAPASASDPSEPTPAADAAPGDPTPHRRRGSSAYVWGGLGVPLVNFNTTDGLGFGLGAQLFDRKRGTEFGYRYRLTVSTFWTTSGNYTSNYLQLERRSTHTWMARINYQRWKNMPYVGAGGAEVSVRNGAEAEGNLVESINSLTNVVRKVRNTPLYVYAQVYARYAFVEPNPGGLLDTRRPLGAEGGFYFDAGGGLFINEIDRWPMPIKGIQAELALRAGGTAHPGGFSPLFGVRGEVMGWLPVVGDWLVFGGRAVLDKPFGERPFYEQEFLSGQDRDEVAYEQMLTGYGRTRSRGDGVFASLVEVRGKLGRAQAGFFDMGFYLSAFVESAYLFEGNNLGPHMPSVGFAPMLLWQGGIVLRPFASWGWLSEEPGGVRTPQMQFGISLNSAM